jgi:hypothetical protein
MLLLRPSEVSTCDDFALRRSLPIRFDSIRLCRCADVLRNGGKVYVVKVLRPKVHCGCAANR